MQGYQDSYFTRYHSLKLTRDAEGILVAQFHTNGGPLTFTAQDHTEFVDAFYRIAQDRANKIVILTGAGGEFIPGIDFASFGNVADPGVWSQVHDEGVQIVENIANIRVPVIAALEGRAHVHSEYALLASLIVASEGATFHDLPHFAGGLVPGDGIFTTWSYRAGAGRAEAFLLNPQPITAAKAHEWGVVAEIVPNGKALNRARELAKQYMKAPEVTRRNTRIHLIQPLGAGGRLRTFSRRRVSHRPYEFNADEEWASRPPDELCTMSRLIIVSGASKGIGLASAEALAAGGWEVIGIARHSPPSFPGLFVTADLSDPERTAELASSFARTGKVHGIVNNVGIAKNELFECTTFADLSAIMDLNIRPALQLTQALLPGMRKANFGRVISVSSLVTRGFPFRSSYAAAKSALESLTRTMAVELAKDGITANVVAPGPTETELFRENNPHGSEGEKRYLARVPMGRFAKPYEIAAAIAFLASDNAGFVTGQTLFVDGGSSLGMT